MMARLRITATTHALGAACTGLLVVVSLQLAFPARLPEPADNDTNTTEVPEFAAPPAYVPAPFDNYVSILERPLLYATRRLPAPEEEEPEAQAQREPLRLKLEGVALASGSRVALLRDEQSNALITMGEGMSHNGWMLENVRADRAVFTRNKERSELMLEVTGNKQNRRRR